MVSITTKFTYTPTRRKNLKTIRQPPNKSSELRKLSRQSEMSSLQGSVRAESLRNYLRLMIRNVLNDYLSSIRDERDFDFPLASLLSAMGFYDIHFTHGGSEIGKDFIAKKQENGIEYQYALQSKKGDINQAEFRNT